MTTTTDSIPTNELEEQAREAELDLLSTIDALAERRRRLSAVWWHARSTFGSAVLILSAVLALGAASAFQRKPRGIAHVERRSAVVRAGALMLLGVSFGLLAVGRRARGPASLPARRFRLVAPKHFPHATP